MVCGMLSRVEEFSEINIFYISIQAHLHAAQ